MQDVHCHIGLYDNPMLIANEAEEAGLITLSMTNLPSEFDYFYLKFQGFRRVRLALGLHPLEAPRHRQYYSMFQRLLPKTSFIGEVGLDFSQYGKATKDLQLESFRFVLNCIKDQIKVVSVHSRSSERMVLELLKDYGIKNVIFHWYSGSLKTLENIIEQGYYFSINDAMTRSPKGLSIIAAIPKSKLLLETDGPFIKIKGRQIKPIDTNQLILRLQGVWQDPYEQVVKQLRKNVENLIYPLRQMKKA